MLLGITKPLQGAILIKIDYDLLIQRITGRRTCLSCGAVYNIYTSPSKLEDHCDQCGGNLHHRADDNEETISNRLRVYETQTSPLINYYREQDKLFNVQGTGEIDEIFDELCKVIDTIEEQEKRKQQEQKRAMTEIKSALNKIATSEESHNNNEKQQQKTKETAVTSEKKAKEAPKQTGTIANKEANTMAAKPKRAAAATKKKAAAKKKVATKKAAPKKKAAVKKKAAKKKVAAKKKAAPKKKVAAKKKAAKKRK